jgi:hypothetical protein
MSDNTVDNEGTIIMRDKANCDTNSCIIDELHSQIKEVKVIKTDSKQRKMKQVYVDLLLDCKRYQ